MTSFKNSEGWTLIEVISVVAIVAILALMMIETTHVGFDGERSAATLAKLTALRGAILGTTGESYEGERKNFGFVGDMGRLPANLGELTTQGAQPAWTFNTYYGVGAGWRGPYVTPNDSSGLPLQQDAWGRALTYATLGTAVLRSLGADNASGGAGDNTDLESSIPPAAWLSTVTGVARDANLVLGSATVTLAYPVNGVLTTYNTLADANGFFRFNTVPMGVRALRVRAFEGSAASPRMVSIDRHPLNLPDSATNTVGGLQELSYQSGSANLYSSGTNLVLHLRSTYPEPVRLQQIVITWTGGGTYSSVALNGVAQTISPAASSGATTTIGANMVAPGNSVDNSLELVFSSSKSGVALTIDLYWVGRTRADRITVTP